MLHYLSYAMPPPLSPASLMGAQPAAPILLPKHGPSAPFDVFVYNALPGDVLFFPESHAHIVETWAGPNLMVSSTL